MCQSERGGKTTSLSWVEWTAKKKKIEKKMCIQTTTMIDYYFHSSPPYLFLSICLYSMYIRMYSTTCILVISFVHLFVSSLCFFFSPSSPSASSSFTFAFYFKHLFFLSFFHHPTPTHHQTHLSIYIHPSQHPASQVSQLWIFHFPCVRAWNFSPVSVYGWELFM